jgi:outer membrane protein TolC
VSQVIAYHPSIKEAKLNRPIADANLMSSKGAFDPNIAFVRGDNISTKDNQYQNQSLDMNLPLYTGGNVKFGNRNYNGSYYTETGNNFIEAEIPLLKNLITDYRRNALNKAKINIGVSEAFRDQMINDVMYAVVLTYSEWYLAFESENRISAVAELAKSRQLGLRQLLISGAGNAVDTMETFVQWQQYEAKRRLYVWKTEKQRLLLSMYLWDEDGNAVEPAIQSMPSKLGMDWIDSLVQEAHNSLTLRDSSPIIQPSIQLSRFKLQSSKLDFQLAKNQMLPNLDLKYRYYQPGNLSNPNPININETYGFGVSFQSGIFLRQQRGQYNMMKFGIAQQELNLQNKLRNYQVKSDALYKEYTVISEQSKQWNSVAENQWKLYSMEKQRLNAGDVNFFILNTREIRLLDAQLTALEYGFQRQESGINFLYYLGWLRMR